MKAADFKISFCYHQMIIKCHTMITEFQANNIVNHE